MIIDPSHPTFTLSPHIQEAANDLFRKYHLNYFQYLSVYADGSFSLLCNQAKWLQFVLDYLKRQDQPAVYSHISRKEVLSKQSYYFLWEPNLPQKPVMLAREFNIANGLCFVERFPDHYNLIAFATPVSNYRAVDTYINHIGDLQKFIQTFKHDKKKMIEVISSNRFYPGKSQQDVNLKKMLFQGDVAKNEMIHWKGKSYHLTGQEYLCLRHLAQGKSHKWIADEMGISPRTVETYLNRVKVRHNLHSKKELIALYHDNTEIFCP